MEALERDGLVDLIDEVIGGDKVKDSKPSPDGLNMAIRNSKIDLKNTLYVGDSKSDGLAARAAGIGFVAVLTGMTSRRLRASTPPKRDYHRGLPTLRTRH